MVAVMVCHKRWREYQQRRDKEEESARQVGEQPSGAGRGQVR